ncbi:MAG: Spy/CpxP family protein refolding chaperone [Methylococcales bacterium]
MKKTIFTLSAVTLLCAAPVSSIANEEGFENSVVERANTGFRQEKRLNRLVSLLELSNEQQASIEMLNDTFNEQINTLRESMKENRAILETLAEAVPVDSNAIQQVADAQGDLFSDLVILKTEKHIAFAAILTQVQLEKLEELNATVKERRYAGDEDEANGTID